MIFISSKISDGNMSLKYGNPKKVLENRKKFFKRINIDPKNIVEVAQIYSNKVLLINKIPNPDTEADGLITNNPNLYLMLKLADCMAIGLYDQKHNAVGLIHVGFIGSENGIIKNSIEAMKQNFETDPKDLIIKISPSIGSCCYWMDIWKKAEDQLTACGVLKENIDNPKICTYESRNYFSHRRSADSGEKEGRFVTILGLKNVN